MAYERMHLTNYTPFTDVIITKPLDPDVEAEIHVLYLGARP